MRLFTCSTHQFIIYLLCSLSGQTTPLQLPREHSNQRGSWPNKVAFIDHANITEVQLFVHLILSPRDKQQPQKDKDEEKTLFHEYLYRLISVSDVTIMLQYAGKTGKKVGT